MWRPEGRLRSSLMLGLMLAGGTLISGCDQRGFSGVQAEWERRKSQQFYVVAASSHSQTSTTTTQCVEAQQL